MQQQYRVSGCTDQRGYMMNVGFYQGQDVCMDLCVAVFWQSPAERLTMENWILGLMALVKPYSNGHVYQNYPDGSRPNYRCAY